MNKKYLGVGVLVVVVVGMYFATGKQKGIEQINGGVNQAVGVGTTTPVERRKLSLDNWQEYVGTKAGLKSEVLFYYPVDWYSVGAGGGGGSTQNDFKDTQIVSKGQENSGYKVAYLAVSNYGHLASSYESEFATVLLRESVNIDGWPGELIYRSVKKTGELERREWWLVLPQVGEEKEFLDTYEYDGNEYSCDEVSCPTKTSYEFYMEDVYINTEDVFRQIIESIEFPGHQ